MFAFVKQLTAKSTPRMEATKDVNGKTLTEENGWFEYTKKLYEAEKVEECEMDWAELEPDTRLSEVERSIAKIK